MKKLTFADLRNNTEHQFIDISTEQYRIYYNPAGEVLIHIAEPVALAVSPSGHRVLDSEGVAFWINTDDFSVVEWKSYDGAPHFIK